MSIGTGFLPFFLSVGGGWNDQYKGSGTVHEKCILVS